MHIYTHTYIQGHFYVRTYIRELQHTELTPIERKLLTALSLANISEIPENETGSGKLNYRSPSTPQHASTPVTT
jgi:hypothetical protein